MNDVVERSEPEARDRVASHALLSLGLPPKPSYSSPCNHCGLCCTLSLCPVAEQAFPGESAPCRALVIEDGKATCGLVTVEDAAGMDGMIRRVLGIGCGCSMPDDDTTEAEIEEFDRLSMIRVYGDNK